MQYKGVLERYLLFDIVAILLLLIVIILIVVAIKKLLPADDPTNITPKRILYAVLIIGSFFALYLASTEMRDIFIDIRDEAYISANGSFTTDKDRMYLTKEDGEQVLLKIRPIVPEYGSHEQATVVYSKHSKILLDVILN